MDKTTNSKKVWYILDNITCDDFIIHMLKIGKPIDISLVGVFGTGEVGKVLIWSLIDDTQTKNYANINTDQSSSFAEINETQTPNWEEVA